MAELRTTTGQRMSISYDPTANALIFREDGWHPEAFRFEEAPQISRLVRPIGAAVVTRIRAAGRRGRLRIVGQR